MQLIYKKGTYHAIAESLLQKEKLNYSKIYEAVVDNTGHTISHRDFAAHLKQMVNDNILHKQDSNKRGTSVDYSLTKKALRQNQLKILGIEGEVQKRKTLYKLLLFYESYKRRPLLTDRQLRRFLKKIGYSITRLEKIESSSPFDNTIITTFKPIKDIEILAISQSKVKLRSKSSLYYIVTPGFSIEEFTHYLRKLKRGKDPRPFSRSSPGLHVPFIRYMDYSEEEVVKAIEAFRQDGLIKPTIGIFPGEMRFVIADKSLVGFIHSVWLINIVDFHLLIRRLAYESKPTAADKEYLSLFLGKKGADKMLAAAYHIRKSQNRENDDQEIEKDKKPIRELINFRKSLTEAIAQKYEKVIKEQEIAAGMMQEICFSPFIS